MSAAPAQSGPRFLRPWLVRLLVAIPLLVLVLAGGLFTYVLFYMSADIRYVPPAWPRDGARLQRLDPTFSWPDNDLPEWEFRLLDGTGQLLYSERVQQRQVTLPYDLLKMASAYRWELAGVDGDEVEESPRIDRHFRTAEKVTQETLFSDVTLFPAQFQICVRDMLGHLTLEVDYPGPFRVELPGSLVFGDGEKLYHGWGRTVLRFEFDQARAAGDPARWGAITVWAGAHTVKVPVVPGTYREKAYSGHADPRFDPYADTPRFANFEKSLFSRLTEGTCVGIALVVKLFFERVAYGEQRGVPADFLTADRILSAALSSSRVVVRSSVSFRDLAEKRSDMVMDLMSALHFENLDPRNIVETLRSLLGATAEERTLDFIWRELTAGRVPVVAGFRLKKKVLKTPRDLTTLAMLDSGHAFLVYRGWRFGGTSVFAVYDPNYEYDPRHPRHTTLVFRADERPVYYLEEEAQQALVRFLPLEPSGLFSFFSIVAHGAGENLRTAGRSLVDLYHILVLE